MKKRLLLVLVLGISFAPPVLGAEKVGQQTMRETFETAAAGVNCKEGLRAKNLASESNTSQSGHATRAGRASQ
ncbi:MAG TPA: hypothetical protein DCS07_14740 [Bdellovibrionales bacterium]|nr:MAG: hypothetical protein A2Z97_13975 [Bdellovibrionales bacterium GWB1_52_6]OFZ06407.1 MAG: hypothetical protein A2X97_03025 [Bdellovibrionales bacterium GWA1_52_35]OFZ39945.1 MAG: hypothetical protein A2070_07820 [Bdellovibrionales bacterium GWC1_52_8]HAR43868.1 hypothetical protein [Bdellovibrionales bacterium]HCM40165.1 hypothetical protein [Bdellovibrionales bacterium]